MKTLHHSLSRIIQMDIAIAFLCFLVLPASAQEPLFSQYGYQNLSFESGVPNTVPVYRVETAIDGDVLHLLWVDERTAYNTPYKVWYRRSNDLGLTWEKPVEVMGTSPSYSYNEWRKRKFMSVADGKVYIVAADGDSLVCLTTTNGLDFQRQILNCQGQSASFVKAVGGKVAVCYQSRVGLRNDIHIAYSEDGGASFSDSLVTCTYGGEEYNTDLESFDFDGTTMAALTTWGDSWLADFKVWLTSSTDGKTFYTTQLATELTKDDGTKYNNGRSAKGDNGAFEPYTHIAINGNYIYALTLEQLTNDDKCYLTLHRSVDGGQTWAEPQQVCTDLYKPKDCNAYIKANGNDVYILTDIDDYGQYEIRNLIFHSADRGETFECQTDWTETIHNRGHISDYTLTFDPSDKTGKTIYLAGNDYACVKTTDGFATIDEVSMNDNYCPDNVGYWKNLYTNMEIDDNGVKHWFIRYRPNGAKRHEVIYRRETSEPIPGTVDKALDIAPLTEEGYAQNRVLIPNNQNFHGTAMTMEMWVKTDDTENDLTFAYLSHTSSQDCNYGIRFGLDEDWSGKKFFASLCNDKDDRITLTCKSPEMTPDRWYHLALTYDEATHQACFYVNGVLADEKDFYGAIGWGWNPIVIGNPMDWTSKVAYLVDDFRLWNRALSAKEIQTNMRGTLTSAEGLKVNLGFDDTLLDLSGNGNSGYGMANVDFTDSDRAIPNAYFDICQTETGEVVFSNHSEDADSYFWSFGDGATSTLSQPTHVYDAAGEYEVSLVAGNTSAFASDTKVLTVAGLRDIQPRHMGNTGKVLTTIMGGGIAASQKIYLVNGSKEIVPSEVWEEQPGILKAWFEVEGAELGSWTLRVGNETLTDAITMEEAHESKPWMTFQGRSKILYNKWATYTISYGNKGNVDAYNVPLNFLISHYPDLEVEMTDFSYTLPETVMELFPDDYIHTLTEALKTQIGDYIIIKDYEGKEWRCYPFQVPVIKAGSSQDIHLRLKTSADIQIKYWSDNSWGQLNEETQESDGRRNISDRKMAAPSTAEQADCMLNYIGMGVLDATIDLIPFGGCAWGAAKTIYGVCTDDAKDRLYNLAWNLGTASLSCLTGGLSNIGKIGYITATSIGMGAGLFGNMASAARCTGGPANSSSLRAVTSWDPNEMIGPSQYMDEDSVHWISSDGNLPYKILFENKKEATAPAHTVFVTDTLDTATMDLNNFSFTSIGWGNTIVNIPGEQRTEFSMDIDMRPSQPYIVRATGKLDKDAGVVNWLFVTLNPQTMDEEEDPEIGFLPPNNDNNEGEGFVSFIVGQKATLNSGTKIENLASIVFDANQPILTNNFINGVDTDLPSSAAYLVSEYDQDHLLVQWSGSDTSSGVAWYDVYVSTDNDFYEPVMEMVNGESAFVDRIPDTNYYFYTVVTDNVGNMEQKSGSYDVMYVPTGIHYPNSQLSLTRNSEKSYDVLLPVTAIEATMKVYDNAGREIQSQSLGSGSQFNIVLQTSGVSILVIEADGRKYIWKLA